MSIIWGGNLKVVHLAFGKGLITRLILVLYTSYLLRFIHVIRWEILWISLLKKDEIFIIRKKGFSESLVDHISNTLSKSQLLEGGDRPWRTLSGCFSMKSVWNLLRNKKELNEDFNNLWHSGLPFKISFLAWKVWLGKVVAAHLINSWNSNLSTDCRCCLIP